MLFAPVLLLVVAQRPMVIHSGPRLPTGEPQVAFLQYVDRTRVGTEETFVLTLSIVDLPEADVAAGVKVQLKLPKGVENLSREDDFQLRIEEGTWWKDVNLTLRVTKAGRVRIPAAILKTRSTTVRGAAIDVDVIPGRVEVDARPLMFVRADLDRENVTIGQTAVLTFTLYSQYAIASLGASSFAPPAGVPIEERPVPSQLEDAVVKTGSGTRFHTYLIRQLAITPAIAGPVDIGAMTVEAVPIWSGKTRKVTASSASLTLTVDQPETAASP